MEVHYIMMYPYYYEPSMHRRTAMQVMKGLQDSLRSSEKNSIFSEWRGIKIIICWVDIPNQQSYTPTHLSAKTSLKQICVGGLNMDDYKN
mgnify:CR=1 FL=1